jgi:hypothetical protein
MEAKQGLSSRKDHQLQRRQPWRHVEDFFPSNLAWLLEESPQARFADMPAALTVRRKLRDVPEEDFKSIFELAFRLTGTGWGSRYDSISRWSSPHEETWLASVVFRNVSHRSSYNMSEDSIYHEASFVMRLMDKQSCLIGNLGECSPMLSRVRSTRMTSYPHSLGKLLQRCP